MNILFIGGQGRRSDANGVCIRNMAREMRLRGHNVWILAMGDEKETYYGEQDGATLIEVPMDSFSRLFLRNEKSTSRLFHLYFIIISILRHIVLLLFYPNTSPLRSIKMKWMAKSIVESNDVKLVVTTFCPYENIYAGLELKKFYGENIRIISYHLDLRTGSQNSVKLIREYIYKHALSSLIEENNIVDRMLIPYSGQEETERLKELDFEKVKYVGFPVYLNSGEKNQSSVSFDHNFINISYIGSLHAGNRDPHYILYLLEELSHKNDINVRLHIWGDTESFDDVIKRSEIAVYHGMIDNGYVRDILDKSDFLLNFGNTIAYKMLPSKAFSLFATGKPIINMVGHPKDVTLPYFARYNNSIEICEYDKKKDDVIKLEEFITKQRRDHVDNIDNIFEDFTPQKICDIILA